MDKEIVRKIIGYAIGPIIVLFFAVSLSQTVSLMLTAEPASVEMTHYNYRKGTSGRSSTASVNFTVKDGQYAGKGHSMKVFPGFKLHKVGDILSGYYQADSGVVMTNKYAWAVAIVKFMGMILGVLVGYGVIRQLD